jgi:hypothetical protein
MKKAIGSAVAIAVLGVFVFSASVAWAQGSEEAQAAAVDTQLSPQALSECPSNAMCAWAGREFNSTFSWWAASETGCHNHAFNPELRSFWNRTGYTVTLEGIGVIYAGETKELASGAQSLAICW